MYAESRSISLKAAFEEAVIGKRKEPKRSLSNQAKCPTCATLIEGTLVQLRDHYQKVHGRMPTDAETYQFRSYKKKDFAASRYQIGFKKSRLEVSGGLPSLGKKR